MTPNYYSYGEESEVVKNTSRSSRTPHLTTEPDGNTQRHLPPSASSKQEQPGGGRLPGPSTRRRWTPRSAANAISLGDSGEAVTRVQNLLYEYNYLKKSHVTGYFGDCRGRRQTLPAEQCLTADGDVGKTMNALTGSKVVKAKSLSPAAAAAAVLRRFVRRFVGSNSTSSGVQKLIEVAKSSWAPSTSPAEKAKFDCSGRYWCLNQIGVKQSYLISYGWRSIGNTPRSPALTKSAPATSSSSRGMWPSPSARPRSSTRPRQRQGVRLPVNWWKRTSSAPGASLINIIEKRYHDAKCGIMLFLTMVAFSTMYRK